MIKKILSITIHSSSQLTGKEVRRLSGRVREEVGSFMVNTLRDKKSYYSIWKGRSTLNSADVAVLKFGQRNARNNLSETISLVTTILRVNIQREKFVVEMDRVRIIFNSGCATM